MASNTPDISSVSTNSHSQAAVGTFHTPVYFGRAFQRQRQHDPSCLPDTRVDLLQGIYNWADGRDERCIFWLNGLAGTGKSTIARTVARTYDQKRLGASFFFSRGGADVGHAGKFIPSITLQLASSIPSLDQHIYDALTERRDIMSQSLRDQWQQLVIRPLLKLGRVSCQSSSIVKDDSITSLLTSRPVIPIRYGFGQIPDVEHMDFVLHNISSSIVDHDIRTFLRHELELIAARHHLGAGWPGDHIVEQLVHSAHELFIWAATACRFNHEGRSFAADRLSIILKANSVVDSVDGFSSDDCDR
ncbi:hypothetical protein P152DRAFT_451987 [Eremomyces bilateralis CBS 781.70]|uniref:Nephrocystin 3-like N-terminal domain-containing protein n=1 Tax=Eremomyces bilateralis CBS 781.70 TaxID=1392243 RepID=A0A6G1FV59_9PEZI|nr:uncharacterized protein P152DRAFT_451987 [Eremomyces bilateralis CBS 781.70]KAF1809541.1 hypothetical protein P152DRAFT_451987 [Eremomyces bilateralis CBS 781.70]